MVISLILALFLLQRSKHSLPPGPPTLYILAHLLWFSRTVSKFESYVKSLWSKYGPIVTIKIGNFALVMVADRHLTHKMLINHGDIFADRPPPPYPIQLTGVTKFAISTANYGPVWRILRRNLAGMISLPIVKKASAQKQVVQIIIEKLREAASVAPNNVVQVRDIFEHSNFRLAFILCFGETPTEEDVEKIRDTSKKLLRSIAALKVVTMQHKVEAYLFKERYNQAPQSWKSMREIIVSLIKGHIQKRDSSLLDHSKPDNCYLDRLLNLRIEDNSRSLTIDELAGVCSEFFLAFADNNTAMLEWIMANIVINSAIQEKLFQEVRESHMEEDLQKLPYLNAVILEGLRRHPPGHIMIPHALTEDITLDGYTFRKGAAFNFGVALINQDEAMWPNPLEFRPERFLPGGEGEGVDIRGRSKIQMMPFGVGQRMCPGMDLALINIHYVVANLVHKFRWEASSEGVDLSEKYDNVIFMKNPLRASIITRR